MLKKLFLSLPILAALASVNLAYADIDDYDLSDHIQGASFEIGEESPIGRAQYIVIRTTGQCFLQIVKGSGTSLAEADCKALEKVPAIKTYIETGKTPN